MAKRKRDDIDDATSNQNDTKKSKETPADGPASSSTRKQTHIQIITGSYERILHGIIASIPSDILFQSEGEPEVPCKATKSPAEDPTKSTISFADTFLFTAHTSSVRCLALSPPSLTSSKTLLATGSSDSRINLYTLSTSPPSSKSALPSLAGTAVLQNPRNKEVGSLQHHNGTITVLSFPSRGKLISASEDNTIAITRVRDWTVLSTIRAPMPKGTNRPSGDTAAQGEAPGGINDFALHPSSKIMISVGRGERCMRLWNLVTGKRAGVLQFEKKVLEAVGEGKHSTGEGRFVRWGTSGEEFVVAFERGLAVFGMDCRVKRVLSLGVRTKVQQVRYVEALDSVVAVGTEDGKVCFFDTGEDEVEDEERGGELKEKRIPRCSIIAQLGGKETGVIGRVKDFTILPLPDEEVAESSSKQRLLVTGSSDGTIRLWLLDLNDLSSSASQTKGTESSTLAAEKPTTSADHLNTRQIGVLLSKYETGNRITCLKAFIMAGGPDDEEDKETATAVAEEEDNSISEDSESE